MFTHPFPLLCYDKIQPFVAEYMSNFNRYDHYAERIFLPDDLKNLLEQELLSYGFKMHHSLLAFKRRNYFKPILITVHVDDAKASIVLPIENCKGTSMFWLDGEYDLITRILPYGDPYHSVDWKSNYKIVQQTEITEPTLCRVDVPHDALSNLDGSYRTILSIRLQGDLSFEEVIAKRFTSTSL